MENRTEQKTVTPNIDEGLSSDEAKKRLADYGYNEVPEKKTNPLLKIAKKFWGVTPWMLEATIAMELAFGKNLEAIVITARLQRGGKLPSGGEG
jgi:H+-transporting ATPase